MQALATILAEKTRVIGAGRTDAGVHARGQVVSFKTQSPNSIDRIPAALNSVLPRDMAVWQTEEVSLDFHARYDATYKIYRYLISLDPTRHRLCGTIAGACRSSSIWR